jgi:hypothetical protein
VNLRVRLQMVECLQYNLHELILNAYELLYLRVVVGLAIAFLAIAWIVPCVHHLRDFDKRDISFSRIETRLYAVIFLLIFI